MTYFIDDPRKWRLSKSGFSIKAGWADEKKIIAKYPGALSPVDAKEFQEWMGNAERICELHNAPLIRGEQEDGARYRWLRDGNRDTEGICPGLSGSDMDAAIDAAMLKTPNVELTGAARLHRAASSERSERGRAQG